MPGILEYSTLLRIALISTGLINSHASFETTIDRRPQTYHGTLFNKQKISGVYPQGVFEEVSAADILETNRPDYFASNIRSIVAIAESRGIEVVLSSFAWSPLFTEQPKVASDEYNSAYRENNRLLQAMATETGQQFFDFAAKFPTEKRWYSDGRHVNESGAQLKAELFGDFLINAGLLPPRSP